MNTESKIKKNLFLKEIKAFNQMEFYDAHEYWEDLWSDYQLKDAKFIQALIQLSVGYFHISNNNRNGALGLFKKCIPKFQLYLPTQRGININKILKTINNAVDNIAEIDKMCDFDWKIVPKLKINNE